MVKRNVDAHLRARTQTETLIHTQAIESYNKKRLHTREGKKKNRRPYCTFVVLHLSL